MPGSQNDADSVVAFEYIKQETTFEAATIPALSVVDSTKESRYRL